MDADARVAVADDVAPLFFVLPSDHLAAVDAETDPVARDALQRELRLPVTWYSLVHQDVHTSCFEQWSSFCG